MCSKSLSGRKNAELSDVLWGWCRHRLLIHFVRQCNSPISKEAGDGRVATAQSKHLLRQLSGSLVLTSAQENMTYTTYPASFKVNCNVDVYWWFKSMLSTMSLAFFPPPDLPDFQRKMPISGCCFNWILLCTHTLTLVLQTLWGLSFWIEMNKVSI